MANRPTIRDTATVLLDDMSFWDWFATGEVLFLGRFAEAHHLPNTPTPNVIEVCLNLDDKTRVQNPARHMADLMPDQRFIDTQPAGQTIIDKSNGARITFIGASTLPYRPPMVPLAQARANFDSAIADPLDLIALGICEVSRGTDNDHRFVAHTVACLAERITTSDSPLLMFSDTQRELVLGHLPGFLRYSGKSRSWWESHIVPRVPSMLDRVLARGARFLSRK